MGILKKYGCGLWHVGAIKKEMISNLGDRIGGFYDCHWLGDLSELNYLTRYKRWLPGVVVIELENSISEQLKIKKYLEKLVN